MGVSIKCDAFGGKISGALIGGILTIGEDGQIIPSTAPVDTPVKDWVLFMGVEGGFEIPAIGGLSIRFAVTQWGPLGILVNANYPIPFEPTTGLSIGNFVGGVELYTTLPDYNHPLDMQGNALSFDTAVNAETWLNDVKQQVFDQYTAMKKLPFLLSGLAAYLSPITITGSGRLYSVYLSQIILNGQVGFKFSSDGKFYAEGKLNF
jgi:hypothetical protein